MTPTKNMTRPETCKTNIQPTSLGEALTQPRPSLPDIIWRTRFYERVSAVEERPSVLYRLAHSYGERALERRAAGDTREQGRFSRKASEAFTRAATLEHGRVAHG